MNFAFTESQEALRRDVRALMEDSSPPSAVRRTMETAEGFDRSLWRRMAARFGGLTPGSVEAAVVAEETGRAVACVPWLSTMALAVNALVAAGDGAAVEEVLTAVASGAVATLAVAEDARAWNEAGIATVASPARPAGGWVLEGTKTFVLDGHAADHLVVAARAPAGVSLFMVAGDAPGLERRALPTVDLTRRQAALRFRRTPARLVGGPGEGWPAVSTALQLAVVALAAEQAGGAQRCLELTVSHARSRVQFGRPIGAFQAVKHTCAEMLLDVELARSAAYYAAWSGAVRDEGLPTAASVAKACCSDAYVGVATGALHLHGALGFTWDHEVQLHFKRARSSAVLFGDAAHHRELLAARLSAPGA